MPGEELHVDYYRVLGVSRRATREDIDQAYYQLARELHPDVVGESPGAVARFARINEAYLVLSDPEERQWYDEELSDIAPWEPAPVVVTRVSEPEVVSARPEAPDSGSPTVVTRAPEPEVVSARPETRPKREAAAPKPERRVRAKPGSRAVSAKGVMSPEVLARLKANAGMLIREGDFWRSGNLLSRAAMSFPRDPEVRRLQARAAEGRGRLREAAEFLKSACEAEYFNPENHVLLGRVYMKAEQFLLARKSLENALSWQEDHEGAMKAMEELRRLEGHKTSVWKRIFGGRGK